MWRASRRRSLRAGPAFAHDAPPCAPRWRRQGSAAPSPAPPAGGCREHADRPAPPQGAPSSGMDKFNPSRAWRCFNTTRTPSRGGSRRARRARGEGRRGSRGGQCACRGRRRRPSPCRDRGRRRRPTLGGAANGPRRPRAGRRPSRCCSTRRRRSDRRVGDLGGRAHDLHPARGAAHAVRVGPTRSSRCGSAR